MKTVNDFRKNKIVFLPILFCNALILAIFIGMVLPAILFEDVTQGQAQVYDQDHHHLPQVKVFVDDPLSIMKTKTYKAIKTPGHFLFLAIIAHLFADGNVGPEVLPIRLGNACLGLMLILSLWWFIYARSNHDILKTTCSVFPLLFSYYFLSSSIWVFTDNGALLWTCVTLFILSFQRGTNKQLILVGILSTLAILWRQMYLWLIVPVSIKALQVFYGTRRWIAPIIALLIPIFAFSCFIFMWGGLIPPQFRSEQPTYFNAAVPLYVMCLFGIFGFFFSGFIWGEIKEIVKCTYLTYMPSALLIGLITSLITPSTFDETAGRWGGLLWLAAQHLPVFWNRSILFIVLAPLGAVSIYLWFKATYLKNTGLIFFSLGAWTLALTINAHAWQRYYEPFLLMFFAFLAASVSSHSRSASCGPALLGVILGASSFYKIYF